MATGHAAGTAGKGTGKSTGFWSGYWWGAPGNVWPGYGYGTPGYGVPGYGGLVDTGVTPSVWAGAKTALKRSIIARALGTWDSAAIDEGVARADAAFAQAYGYYVTGRATGLVPEIAAGLFTTLLIVGGAAMGVAGTLWLAANGYIDIPKGGA